MTYIVLIFCIVAFLFFLEIRFKNELTEVEKELNKIKSEIKEFKLLYNKLTEKMN